MGDFKDPVEIVAHNFNNSTLTIDKNIKVDGLNTVSVDLKENEIETESVASGMSQFVETDIITGTLTFEMLEASPSTDTLWELWKLRRSFPFSFLDSKAPNFDCSASHSRFVKRPTQERKKGVTMVTWTVETTYLKTAGGSYTLAASTAPPAAE